jgi:hypothetical protein
MSAKPQGSAPYEHLPAPAAPNPTLPRGPMGQWPNGGQLPTPRTEPDPNPEDVG